MQKTKGELICHRSTSKKDNRAIASISAYAPLESARSLAPATTMSQGSRSRKGLTMTNLCSEHSPQRALEIICTQLTRDAGTEPSYTNEHDEIIMFRRRIRVKLSDAANGGPRTDYGIYSWAFIKFAPWFVAENQGQVVSIIAAEIEARKSLDRI